MFDDRIVDWAPRGQHIGLECKICGAQFHTKNIAPLGCRTLFYYSGSDALVSGVECDNAGHKLADLEVVRPREEAK